MLERSMLEKWNLLKYYLSDWKKMFQEETKSKRGQEGIWKNQTAQSEGTTSE